LATTKGVKKGLSLNKVIIWIVVDQ